MTEAEKAICKLYLEELDKHHTCNEYKLLMQMLEQEPCDDAVSREAAVNACLNKWDKDYKEIVADIRALPPVNPQEPILDKIRAEIMDFEEDIFHSTKDYSDYAAVRHCVDIIDKYRQEG